MHEPGDVAEYQPLLFAIAYRMLGSVMDAEDVVQEAFLRWQTVAVSEVESPRAYLSTVVTRLCIDQLRAARTQRETYVGPWLPEPLLTEREPDIAEGVALGETLSMAFLVLLESLTPAERAAFLLHDVFAYDYAEIARILAKSEANCRQLARRARARLEEGRPRFAASPDQQERLTQRFAHACATGDLATLVATLADDVTLWSDGGGKVLAARKPVHGAEKVAHFLLHILRDLPPNVVNRLARVNGQLGIISEMEGHPIGVLTLALNNERIQAVHIVVNPDKLRALTEKRAGG